MEPEGSLPCSQEPSTGPYPEPDQSNAYHLSKIHFNIAHPPTSLSSPWSISFWLSHQYPIYSKKKRERKKRREGGSKEIDRIEGTKKSRTERRKTVIKKQGT
jgi:hypothetical protein